MKGSARARLRANCLLTGFLGVALFGAGGLLWTVAKEPQVGPARRGEGNRVHLMKRERQGLMTPPRAGGMVLYRDPQTGRIGSPPGGVIPEGLAGLQREASAPYSEDLVETPGVSAAGGVKIDLRGRFRATVIRHKSPVGKNPQYCVVGAVEKATGD